MHAQAHALSSTAQAPENRLLRLPAALATACLLLKVVSVERNQLQIPPQVGL